MTTINFKEQILMKSINYEKLIDWTTTHNNIVWLTDLMIMSMTSNDEVKRWTTTHDNNVWLIDWLIEQQHITTMFDWLIDWLNNT